MKKDENQNEPQDQSPLPGSGSEAESRARAAAADEAARQVTGEYIPPGQDTQPEPEVEIDPAMMHALMVQIVKGTVVRIDQMNGWKIHPDDEWADSTCRALEMVLDKWFGKLGTSPEMALLFNVGMWVLPNVLDRITKPQPEPAA